MSDSDRSWTRAETLLLVAAVIVGVAVFAGSIGGEFVYDDARQIVKNDLVLQPGNLGRALFSDVWAFKGGGEGAVSNYWRPAFITWLIANHRVFGLEPAGWHVTNLLLHAAVIAVGFVVLRRLGLSTALTGAAMLVFAVHPCHVESVAWISGSPDMLYGLALLGSFWCVLSILDRPSVVRWAGALVLAASGLASKEPAVVFPALVFVTVFVRSGDGRWRRATLITLPFLALTVVYFVARVAVLSGGVLGPSLTGTLGGIVMTSPGVAAFYLRQLTFPWWLGPSYPLRVVTDDTFGLMSFFVPLIIVGVVAWLAFALARRSPVGQIGLGLLVLPLLPAFNIGAFYEEHLVHDRYLYLPLLGALVLVVPAVAAGLARFVGRDRARAERLCLAGAAAVSALLAVQTIRYTSVWTSEIALWECGIRIDRESSFNHSQLGVFLHEKQRLDEARVAFDRALAIKDDWENPYLGRAEVLIDLGRFADAEADLRTVLERFGDDVRAYQRLAVCYERQQRWRDAVGVLRTARDRFPAHVALLTDMLAVVLHGAGRPDEALRELEGARDAASTELGAGAKMVLFHLGMLYEDLGRRSEARNALEAYRAATERYADPVTRQRRGQAEEVLERR